MSTKALPEELAAAVERAEEGLAYLAHYYEQSGDAKSRKFILRSVEVGLENAAKMVREFREKARDGQESNGTH